MSPITVAQCAMDDHSELATTFSQCCQRTLPNSSQMELNKSVRLPSRPQQEYYKFGQTSRKINHVEIPVFNTGELSIEDYLYLRIQSDSFFKPSVRQLDTLNSIFKKLSVLKMMRKLPQ